MTVDTPVRFIHILLLLRKKYGKKHNLKKHWKKGTGKKSTGKKYGKTNTGKSNVTSGDVTVVHLWSSMGMVSLLVAPHCSSSNDN